MSALAGVESESAQDNSRAGRLPKRNAPQRHLPEKSNESIAYLGQEKSADEAFWNISFHYSASHKGGAPSRRAHREACPHS